MLRSFKLLNYLLISSFISLQVVFGILPEGPRSHVDTSMPSISGVVRSVKAGDNLQAVLDSVSAGETIELEAGATFTGNYILRRKQGDSWIVIRTSAITSLVPSGVRVAPQQASLMPKIVSPNSLPAITAEFGAHHYRLIGIEVTSTAPMNYNLLLFGYDALNTSSRAKAISNLPNNIIIDRMYIHGSPKQETRRGVLLDVVNGAVIDSYFSSIHQVGVDAQAIASFNGLGPFKIVNNYLEAAGENIIFGGADPAIQGLVPSDIEFRRNYCFKPLSWKLGDPSYAGTQWSVKNNFELKNAKRVQVSENIFENNWLHSQDGTAILLTVRNQDGLAPWSTVEDVNFENNLIVNSEGGFLILGSDMTSGVASQQSKRLRIHNNLIKKISRRFFSLNTAAAPIIDLYITHNTGILTGDNNLILQVEQNPAQFVAENFIFTDNVFDHGAYGITGSGTAVGKASLDRYIKNYNVTNNVFYGSNRNNPAYYPSGNFHVQSYLEVGFLDYIKELYVLSNTSSYIKRALDGADIGYNSVILESGISCVRTGSCTKQESPPSPPKLFRVL